MLSILDQALPFLLTLGARVLCLPQQAFKQWVSRLLLNTTKEAYFFHSSCTQLPYITETQCAEFAIHSSCSADRISLLSLFRLTLGVFGNGKELRSPVVGLCVATRHISKQHRAESREISPSIHNRFLHYHFSHQYSLLSKHYSEASIIIF